MRRTYPASSLTLALICTLFVSAQARADGPLRGNPVDAVPQLERPPSATQPPPVVQTATPEQLALQARLAQRIVPLNFDVSGVHAIPFDEVSAILSPLSGKEISLGELVQQVDKITQLYRDKGYPLSFALVQNQTFANGLVVVTVVEGYISNVRIEGDIGNAQDRLDTLAGPLKEERPLKQATLERQLNLMRTVPGVKFTPNMDLPRRADGATELVLTASRHPFSLTGGVADLGTGMQPLVNVGTSSLTPLGEQVKLTAAVPFNTDDVKYVMGEISVPIGPDGLAIKVDGYHYDAKPKDDAIEYLGFERRVKNDRIGIGVSYPILLNNTRSLTGTVGMYAANSKDRYDSRNADLWLQQDSRVRAANIELRYIQISESQTTDVSGSVSKGFDAAGAKKDISSNYGYSATPILDLDFTRYNLNAKQTFALPAQFGLTFSGAAQYSSNILPSSEQVSFGSWRYAMGYAQGEQSGDKGVGVSAELNRRFGTGWEYLSAVQPYALIDYARTWYNNKSLQQLNQRHLSSVALGLRFTDDKYYLFDFNVAKPIGSATVNNDRDVRFNANYSLFYDAF
ncbi:ShlB-type family protein [Achromobacter piechaudii]|uniref:Heme/hemopexin transporter protein HuxB n=1 Tax=Achromobacter piechaudii TaxID=72556 RepID=A0ABN7EZK9_9BURK|nr:ShlB/FhaC/HecB family hemolysin secretion/activation protein [Achromobacter piechaudii]KNY08787.1 ShlB-type family protein [Achromobacter piechaudii]CAB3702104.1 Heme/hemopexin transporter protein HuxB [Achromobacter piechaudii]CAB3850300.1 Heme/hemopexin transporter protein HuxB [Achromobacter piechaudii]CAB3951060.1 Heme/hemopexin transporter protein HuxB [Achromobacter piechaudii]